MGITKDLPQVFNIPGVPSFLRNNNNNNQNNKMVHCECREPDRVSAAGDRGVEPGLLPGVPEGVDPGSGPDARRSRRLRRRPEAGARRLEDRGRHAERLRRRLRRRR